MKIRIITSIVGIPLLLAIIFFSHTVVLPAAVTVFCLIGVWEMLSCLGLNKLPSIVVPSLAYAAVPTALMKYLTDWLGGFPNALALMASLTFGYIFFLMCVAVVSHGKKDVAETSLAAMTTVYITAGFTSIEVLRGLENESLKHYGMIVFCLVFVGAWVPDIAAYFGGRAFGKHKLIPDVSPKKTVEGAITGVVFGPVAFIIVAVIVKLLGFGTPNYAAFGLAGAVVAVVSIFGDLIASLIKRKYGVKDYGKLFPGHGGVMDRFDSIIAIAPFILLLSLLPELISLVF